MSSPPHSSDPQVIAYANEPRTVEEIDSTLDRLLDPVLSLRRTALPLAQAIAALARREQDFALHWVAVAARTNIELAYQLATQIPHALSVLDAAAAEAWIVEAMDTYDHEGLHRATEVLRNSAAFTELTSAEAVEFNDVAQVLRLFIHGLSGRPTRLETATQSYTDTETLYFPQRIAGGATITENFALYKATAALLWAQNRYGTFNGDLAAACAGYPDPKRALELLAALETLRLESRIAQVLPGLARELAALRSTPPDPRCASLLKPEATVQDSIALIGALYDAPPEPENRWGIVIEPAHAAAVRRARIAREKSELQAALARLLQEQSTQDTGGEADTCFLVDLAQAKADGTTAYTLALCNTPLAAPPEVSRLIDSIVQDLGYVPDEYLVAGPPRTSDTGSEGVRIPPEGRAFYYDEWDYQRRHYRKSWCVLRELEVQPGDEEFVGATLTKYSGQIGQLKASFERMRCDPRLLKRQPEGDGIDLDAVVEAYADMRHGAELAPLLFTRRRKHERDLAVMFMVDMSGSTKGWINDAAREALVMLCEALEVLGDRYAIYGFSGMTRKRCEIFRVKTFAEPYGPLVHRRIAGIEPHDYTRMGAAIRHLTTLLNRVQARTKLLITLSDGKPDDYSDEYRGAYGIEDTRQALIEAHCSGVKAFCITIDSEARDYLPHMYGAANWTLIDDVSRLPLKAAEIYRRLTA
jgi:nitric oxide reductase NorD protein